MVHAQSTVGCPGELYGLYIRLGEALLLLPRKSVYHVPISSDHSGVGLECLPTPTDVLTRIAFGLSALGSNWPVTVHSNHKINYSRKTYL